MIIVTKTTLDDAYSCNSCTSQVTGAYIKIMFGSTEIRVCRECYLELVKWVKHIERAGRPI